MTTELQLLKAASNEIKMLRNQNQSMSSRLDMFDKCILLLTANIHSQGGCMGEDIAWEIDRYIEIETTVQPQSEIGQTN